MRTRSLLIAAICGVSLLGWALGRGTEPAKAADPCPRDVGATDRAVGVAAVHEGTLVGTVADGTDAVTSVLRHVATGRSGTAYVQDRTGDDVIVVSTARGVDLLPQHGEAYHPTWSAGGDLAWGVDDRLIVRSASGAERAIAGPRPGGIVFAPVFVGRDIVAAVSAAQTPAVPEDGWSDDLWRFDGVRWRRLTAFPAGVDRWTAIRTPFLAADGSVEFVVIRGRGSADRLPRFSLWRSYGDGLQRLASLDGERYLAGYASDGSRLWNVPDRATETWLIQRDTPQGTETVGCGAVAVDPMDAPDPDRVARAAPTPRANDRDVAPLDPGDPMEAALLIGDFTSQVAADVVAQQVTQSYGGSLPVDVVQGGGGSTIVQPDRWAVLVRLAATTDGGTELETMQTRLPEYAEHMWVVVP
jgi:hypothetical protein